MTLSIKHKKALSIPDDPAAAAAGLVLPSDWNDTLNAVMASGFLLGRSMAGNGAVEELDAATARALLGIILGTSAGNVPVLDGSGKLATSVLPALAISEPFVVASQAAMLALTAQQGDIAIRTDLNRTFVLATNSPSTLSDWKELLTPNDAVLAVAGLTGAISAAALRAALNLVIGTDVQAYSGLLASIAGLNLAGKAGQSLAVNAGATGFETVAGGGGITTILDTTTTSGATSIEFTTGFDGTYKSLEFNFFGLYGSSLDQNLYVQHRRASDNVWVNLPVLQTGPTTSGPGSASYNSNGYVNNFGSSYGIVGVLHLDFVGANLVGGNFLVSGGSASSGYYRMSLGSLFGFISAINGIRFNSDQAFSNGSRIIFRGIK